ncbi:MAG: NUDIX domain-containing protein, partial [Rubrivivax sp.]
WQIAESLLPAQHIDIYTQGLMDLGATVCTLRKPSCDLCPLRTLCVAHAQGRVQDYPRKSRRSLRGRRENALLWLARKDQLWLVRRPEKGVWAGLWSLPEFADLPGLQAALADWPGQFEQLPAIDHALTHFDWRLWPVRWTVPPRLGAARLQDLIEQLPPGRWFERGEALVMGLSAPVRKLLEV